jgi:hypothetical protein
MPQHKGCKSRPIVAAYVVLQQLPIGQTRTIPQKRRPTKVLYDPAHLAGRHALSFVELRCPPSYYYLETAV